jgi:hypothetical protein
MDGSRKNISKEVSVKSNTIDESYICKFSLMLSADKSIVNHLNLARFKTEKCLKDACSNKKSCEFFHSAADRRRNPFDLEYDFQICEFGKTCLNKNACGNSHNKFEANYHPLKYRKKYCKHILEIEQCRYGQFCFNAHSDQELKVSLLHFMDQNDDFYIFKYKTEFCPFLVEHNYEKCVYAHSWEDFRRDIMKTPYSKLPCPSWENNHRGTLEQRCKEGANCKYSHGRFEVEFHPMNYKKLHCKEPLCEKSACGYLHLKESPRFREVESKEHFFIHPYNRILPSTFINKNSFFTKKSENII